MMILREKLERILEKLNKRRKKTESANKMVAELLFSVKKVTYA